MTRVFALLIPLALIALAFIRWLRSEKNERRISGGELAFLAGIFCYYFLWAVLKEYDYAPDEAMRYDVTRFVFEHNRLPVDGEVMSHWGFSYAHLPTVLCHQIGALFMKYVSIFTASSRALLIAARSVSVLAGTGSIFFLIKMTRLLFPGHARWIGIVAVAFMPQFSFLSSYINNDSLAFLGITAILYAWALGIRFGWNLKNSFLLALAVAVCGLSYYNSYSWILMSVVFFVLTYFYQNKKDGKGFFKLFLFICAVVILLIGYSFIRHLVLYRDLFGFNTTLRFGEAWAVEGLKPSNRPSLSQQGVTLWQMLISKGWLWTTFCSAIAAFGYMEFLCGPRVYLLVGVFFLIPLVSCVVKVVSDRKRGRQRDEQRSLFYLCAAISAVICVFLALMNSYTGDFQAQGRYCYPAFPALVPAVIIGYDFLIGHLPGKKIRWIATSLICFAFICGAYSVFSNVYLPS